MELARDLFDKAWEFYPLPRKDFEGIMISFFIWTIVYAAVIARLPLKYVGKPESKKISPETDLDIRNRLVSIINGVTLFLLSGNLYYRFPGGCGDPNRAYETHLIYFAVGYFLYDFWAMAYYGLIDMAMTIHHWSCIIGMSLAFTKGVGANYVAMGMFVAEGSNAFMHIRVILRHFGLRYTKAYEMMELAFITIYIFARIFLGSTLTYNNCLCSHNHLVSKCAAVSLMMQTYMFTWQMLGLLRKRFKEIADRKLHRIKIRWFEPLT